MSETRAGKYGRSLAFLAGYTIQSIPSDQREEYRSLFLDELRTFSFEPRREGTPVNRGCVHELSDIVDVDISDPVHLAKLVKEGIHLMYQKNTAKKVFNAMLESLMENYK